jgi:hypothetical protein
MGRRYRYKWLEFFKSVHSFWENKDTQHGMEEYVISFGKL